MPSHCPEACEKLEGMLEAADTIHNHFHKIDLQVLKRFALRFPAPHIIDSVERNEKIAKAEQL